MAEPFQALSLWGYTKAVITAHAPGPLARLQEPKTIEVGCLCKELKSCQC